MSNPALQIGQRVGRIVVVAAAPVKEKRHCWLVRCDCGSQKIARETDLASGRTITCFCTAPKRAVADLTGLRFGRLLVIRRGANNGRHVMWEVACDCGQTKRVRGNRLERGTTRSCGCLARELCSKRARTHGRSHTPEHITWGSMIERCSNRRCRGYRNYGARGISVCERWKRFEHFYADMGPRPSPSHSIDRIDPAGNYEPGNCRWATNDAQQTNKRTNVRIQFNGRELCVAEWSRVTGIPSSRIFYRISKKWPPGEILTVPACHGPRPEKRARGEASPLAKLSERRAREILSLKDKGLTEHEVGARFGVCGSSVGNIWRRITWTHL